MSTPISGISYKDFLPNGEDYDFEKWWDRKTANEGWEDPKVKELTEKAMKSGKLLAFIDGEYKLVDKE